MRNLCSVLTCWFNYFSVENGALSTTLQEVGLAIVSAPVCGMQQTLNATIQICAGFSEGGRDSCQG